MSLLCLIVQNYEFILFNLGGFSNSTFHRPKSRTIWRKNLKVLGGTMGVVL